MNNQPSEIKHRSVHLPPVSGLKRYLRWLAGQPGHVGAHDGGLLPQVQHSKSGSPGQDQRAQNAYCGSAEADEKHGEVKITSHGTAHEQCVPGFVYAKEGEARNRGNQAQAARRCLSDGASEADAEAEAREVTNRRRRR